MKSLIEFLKNEDDIYFISTTSSTKVTDNKVIRFETGFSSLMGQEYLHHPTGLVYNCELIIVNIRNLLYLT